MNFEASSVPQVGEEVTVMIVPADVTASQPLYGDYVVVEVSRSRTAVYLQKVGAPEPGFPILRTMRRDGQGRYTGRRREVMMRGANRHALDVLPNPIEQATAPS